MSNTFRPEIPLLFFFFFFVALCVVRNMSSVGRCGTADNMFDRDAMPVLGCKQLKLH
jgi:hypothetical protein